MDIHKGDLDSQTAYQILGLTPAATTAEIRAAYLTLARQYHPDKQKKVVSHERQDDPVHATSSSDSPAIVRLNEAYSTLATSDSRTKYDAQLLADQTSSVRAKQVQSSTARISAVVDLDEFEVKNIDELDGIPAELRDELVRAGGTGAVFEQLHKLDSIHPHAGVSSPDDGTDDENHCTISGINIETARKQPHPRREGVEQEAEEHDDDNDAESASQVLFVYPCRCGHFFIVHPDELITEAVISDTLADMDQLAVEKQDTQKQPRRFSSASFSTLSSSSSSSSGGANVSDRGDSPNPASGLSILSTCSGCSQVIKVIWGHDDDQDDDTDSDDDSDLHS